MGSRLKPYLVDVPVRVQVWIRPDCQRKQFEILKQARPSILFLCSDGGRNEKEWEAIRENRAMFDNEIDWECTVYKLYESTNQGLYGFGKKMRELIWNTVDRCIFLEDDYLPSVSFFEFCAQMLDKYKDDLRVHCITGMNHMGTYDEVEADYFFSRFGSIWGTATWKRTIDMRNLDFGKDEYAVKNMLKRVKRQKLLGKQIIGYPKGELVGGHEPASEFYNNVAPFYQNQLFIVPKKNMISNVGCTENGEHATQLKKMPKGIQRVFNMKTYEMDFPIKHPVAVFPDYYHEDRVYRIMGFGHPVIARYRKMASFIRQIYYGDGKIVLKKIVKKIKGEKKYEK